ncbi:MAG: A24 family peptidase [Planctomycetales bacterium]
MNAICPTTNVPDEAREIDLEVVTDRLSAAMTEVTRNSKPPRTPWVMGLPITLGLGVISFLLSGCGMHHKLLSWPGMVLVAFAFGTGISDTYRHRLPNWMTYSAALTGLLAGTAVTLWGAAPWTGTLDLSQSLGGFLACFVAMLLPYRATGGGAGDVKLAAAYGALLGWQGGLSVMVWGYVVCGTILIVRHIFSDQPWLLPASLLRLVGSFILPQVVQKPNEEQRKLLRRDTPLGAAFAMGLLCVLVNGNLFGG